MIEITVTAEGEEPRTHQFDAPRLAIGREDDNDLVLESQGCSRHHAEIVREAGGYKLVDLGSTNGVLFGSRFVHELPLADGMEVTIGTHRLAFKLPGQKAAEATMRMSYGAPAAGGPAAGVPAAGGPATAAPQPAVPPGVPQPAPPPAAAPPGVPQPAVPPLYLVVGSGRRERYLKVVPGSEYVLGRSPSADLVLEDGESSKQHALVFARDGRYHVMDLRSSNGTFVNGKRVSETAIAAGDEIVIGQTSVRVEDQILDFIDRANLLERTSLGLPTRGDDAETADAAPPEGWAAARQGGRRGVLVALAAGAVLAAAIGGYFGSRRWTAPPAGSAPAAGVPAAGAPAAPGAGIVQVAPVRSRELVFDLSSSGSVKAQRSVTVSAEVAARVEELAVEEGAAVERGALLLRLDDRDVRHRIEAARASISAEQVELARQDYLRKERLFNDGAVVRSVYEQAKNRYLTLDSTWRSTRATISQLEAQLAKTRVTAPISGVASRVFVAAGEFVGPGSPLVTLDDMDEVLVGLELADRDFVKIRLGQPVEATAAAFSGEVFRGEVARLGSAADPVTRTFEVEARLANPGLRLRPGLIVSLRIVLGREGGLVVPAEAIVEEHDGRGVVFVAREGVARRLEVPLGRRLDREVQVVEGLSEGDEVVVVGHERLVDGQAVEPYREP